MVTHVPMVTHVYFISKVVNNKRASPTYFQFLTLMAFYVFLQEKVTHHTTPR